MLQKQFPFCMLLWYLYLYHAMKHEQCMSGQLGPMTWAVKWAFMFFSPQLDFSWDELKWLHLLTSLSPLFETNIGWCSTVGLSLLVFLSVSGSPQAVSFPLFESQLRWRATELSLRLHENPSCIWVSHRHTIHRSPLLQDVTPNRPPAINLLLTYPLFP